MKTMNGQHFISDDDLVIHRFVQKKHQVIKKRHEQKLVVLSIGVMIAINLPVILIFNHADQVYGVPVLYLFLFSVWLVSILLTCNILSKNA